MAFVRIQIEKEEVSGKKLDFFTDFNLCLSRPVLVAQVLAHRIERSRVPWELGYFLFSYLSYQKRVLDQVPCGGDFSVFICVA